VSGRGFRLEDRVLLVGQTGKGKTTLALWVIQQLQPVRAIIFDPKGEFDFGEHFPPARTPAELRARIHLRLVHYVPASFERDQLEEACRIVWAAPGPYVWLIDEAAEITNPNYCPEGLRLGVTQGRRFRKMVLALTQRLAECHPVFRSQASHIVVFVPEPIALDLKEISRAIRREVALIKAELESLHAEQGDFAHLWWVGETNELRRCAPLPDPASPGQPPVAAADPGEPRQAATAPAGDPASSPPCDSSDSPSAASSRSA
jgi:energy-coupling factor transporter ATP-binding protein EcfA2